MIAEAVLSDGTPALILPLLPTDREALREGYEHLSARTRDSRFLSGVPHLTEGLLHHLVDEVDGIDHIALALVALDSHHHGDPVGVGRIIRYADQPDAADLAVTVIDEWQGRGVARALLAELLRARPVGVTRIVTSIAADNAASIAMVRSLGPCTLTPVGGNCLEVEVQLVPEDDRVLPGT
ncbi:GNAT family N-acetyltransferase [Nocardioides pacificus]